MKFDNPTERELLLADRNRKLEATLRAYDSAINTGAVDAMRRRIYALERALADMANSGDLADEKRAEVEVILGKKFH